MHVVISLSADKCLNLALLCCCLQEEVLLDIDGKNWGAFKPMLADALIAHLEPIQSKYQAIMADPGQIDAVLDKGAAAAAETANATLNLVKDAMGFVVPKRVY
jgi:tryptophanyl-tRNA synthetase